jgi:hypothetical protein
MLAFIWFASVRVICFNLRNPYVLLSRLTWEHKYVGATCELVAFPVGLEVVFAFLRASRSGSADGRSSRSGGGLKAPDVGLVFIVPVILLGLK